MTPLRLLPIGTAVSLLLLVALPSVSVPATLASSLPPPSIVGTITSDLDAPLGGAVINLLAPDGDVVASAVSNPNGTYELGGIAPGAYNLTASARGHADARKDILVVGGALVDDADLELRHTGSVVRGEVLDGRTGDTVAGATVEAQWSFHCKPGGACLLAEGDDTAMAYPMPTSTVSDARGRYALGVEPGSYQMRAWKEGFHDAWREVDADDDATVDLKLDSIPPRTAVLQGRVVDSKTGAAIPDAWISAWPYHPPQPAAECPPDADCPAASSAMMPDRCCSYQEGNSTQSDREGRYRMGMHAGTFMLSASAPDYGQFQQVVELEDGETTAVDIDLERIPDDSVTVRGQVIDKATGEPLAGAYVSVENQQWGHYSGTQTDDRGRFSLTTKPGWTLVWVRADQGCCIAYAQPATAVAVDEGSSGGGSAGSAGNATSVEPEPSSDIGAPEPSPAPPSREGPRDSYYPWVRGQAFEEDQAVEWRVELQPKPKADVRIVGYVLNASSGKPIPGAWVNLHNEDTGDWGYVQTDRDGSFAVMARAGVHTIQAGADRHFGNSVVASVKGPETRVDIKLPPGQSSGYCCVAYAERAMLDEDGSAAGAPPPAAPPTASASGPGGADAQQALSRAPPGAEGPATYQAAGGLGPYDPSRAPSSPPAGPGDDARKAAGPAVFAALAGIAAAGVVLRPRRK